MERRDAWETYLEGVVDDLLACWRVWLVRFVGWTRRVSEVDRRRTGCASFDILALVEVFEDLCCCGCGALVNWRDAFCVVFLPLVTLLWRLAEMSVAYVTVSMWTENVD